MINQTELNEDEKESWNRFVLEQGGSFLQSAEWGEFQKSIGREVYFLRGDSWQALVIKHSLPLGKNYLYCPHGPVILIRQLAEKDLSRMRDFINKTKELAQQENAIFVRIEPVGEIIETDLKEFGFIKTKDVQPSHTLILDLNLSEDELLGKMHEKTRYNIGLAQRKGVVIKNFQFPISNFQFGEFWRLLSQTAKRQKIRLFPKEYYRKQLTVNSERFKNLLFLAGYQGKIIAANLVNMFGQITTYLHGGSDNKFRALMAPHLLQWEQMKYAKNLGCKFYDFWGYDEQKWPGVSRFKKGFGGREISYCGTHDYVFDKKWYKIYKLARIILR